MVFKRRFTLTHAVSSYVQYNVFVVVDPHKTLSYVLCPKSPLKMNRDRIAHYGTKEKNISSSYYENTILFQKYIIFFFVFQRMELFINIL